jgi:glycopeptide antibiotics resistance protein
MIHALAYIAFILPFTAWLGWELNKKYSLKTYWYWVAAAFAMGIIGSFIYGANLNKFGNFLLHMSGGISATFLFIYLTKTLKLQFVNWRVTLIVLFAFVSMLGVLNELAEYLFELLGFGIFSDDTHDVWRDFVANTTGMLLAWLIYVLFTANKK